MPRQLIILLLLLYSCASYSQEIPVAAKMESLRLGKYLSVFQPSSEVPFSSAIHAEFVPAAQDVPNLGLSPFSVWLTFSVNNSSDSSVHLLLDIAYPILDEVELFAPDANGDYHSTEMGEKAVFSDRAYNHPNYIFDLHIPGQATTKYYLRIRSAEQIIVPTTIGYSENVWESLTQQNLISGIYIGIVLIMVLYNLFLFFSVRDTSYLYYVFYAAFAGLTQIGIKGYTFQYLWPNAPSFEVMSTTMFASISGAAALLFTKEFLHTRENAPRSNLLINFQIVLFVAAIVATAAGKLQLGFQLMQFATSLLTVSVLIVSFLIMRKGNAPAKYFFAAWSVLLTGAIVFLLKDYGVLPYNNLTSYSMQAASAIEMALLSFGLADRINTLKKEKAASQERALAILKENETLIKEQNVILENRVEARTRELKETNESLYLALNTLKETQSQLVESEKMASLGQLTAGVAHEINNPINFVTSNVTPLRRDLAMVLDALSAIEKIGLSDLSVAEKQQQIDAYKEELDFDYLKEEINHLLNGVYEGATRTSEIVKSLRIFSRVDEDALKMADINECLDSTLIIVNSLINDKGIRVEKDFADLPQVECYPGKLNQVFLNIISNAIYAIDKQHHEDRKGVLSIRTSLHAPSVIITIKDNGTGMDEKTKEKMFEPFFTTKDVGEGTGLGMSIAYNTIKKHDGDVIVHTAPGEGAEFILKIPLQQKK